MDELLTDATDAAASGSTGTPGPGTGDDHLPSSRSCTRCDGQQHLVAADHGMGKYRCDVCEMVVGFDLAADEPEFLIERGLPSRYTKDVFGIVLMGSERRLEPREPQLAAQD